MAPTCVVVPFAMLDPLRAYDVWRLRQDVFVVEQRAAYADLDGRDVEPETRHVLLTEKSGGSGELLGCARVLDDGDVWRVGRVALRSSARGRGLAGPLMQTALSLCPGRDVVLDAQAALAGFYAEFGFAVDGPGFLEDDIPHLPMRRRA